MKIGKYDIFTAQNDLLWVEGKEGIINPDRFDGDWCPKICKILASARNEQCLFVDTTGMATSDIDMLKESILEDATNFRLVAIGTPSYLSSMRDETYMKTIPNTWEVLKYTPYSHTVGAKMASIESIYNHQSIDGLPNTINRMGNSRLDMGPGF